MWHGGAKIPLTPIALEMRPRSSDDPMDHPFIWVHIAASRPSRLSGERVPFLSGAAGP